MEQLLKVNAFEGKKCLGLLCVLLVALTLGSIVFFGVSSQYSTSNEEAEVTIQWKNWTECDELKETQERVDVDCSLDGECLKESRKCHKPGWSEWSICSSLCGDGQRVREHFCPDSSPNCPSYQIQYKPCVGTAECDIDCNNNRVGDGYCDDDNNWPKCQYDGGDCCLENKNVTYCQHCFCWPSLITKGPCPHLEALDNNACEDYANIEECDFDGGACCGTGNYTQCLECECKDTRSKEISSFLKMLLDRPLDNLNNTVVNVTEEERCVLKWQGDGVCDSVNNHVDCQWDGNDCESYVDAAVEADFFEDNVILIGLGKTVNIQKNFQVLSGSSDKSGFELVDDVTLPDYPFPVEGAMVSMIGHEMILICGGVDDVNEPRNDCFFYNLGLPEYSIWRITHKLSFARYDGAVVVLNQGSKSIVWMTGGHMQFQKASLASEVLHVNSGNIDNIGWEAGPSLDTFMAGHCMLKMSDKKVLILGGYGLDGVARDWTYLYTWPNNLALDAIQIKAQGTLRLARKHHTCSLANFDGVEVPLAVGGFGKDEQVLTSVEIFYNPPGEWALTHYLPRKIKFNSIVRMDNNLLTLGGVNDIDGSKAVSYEFERRIGWNSSPLSLDHKRVNHFSLGIQRDQLFHSDQHPIIVIGAGVATNEIEAGTDVVQLYNALEGQCLIDSTATGRSSLNLGFGVAFVLGDERKHWVHCGGKDMVTGLISDECHYQSWPIGPCQGDLDQTLLKWERYKDIQLNMTRWGAAISQVDDRPTWWITGGFSVIKTNVAQSLRHNSALKSTEVFLVHQGPQEMLNLPDLPFAIGGHCQVQVAAETAFLTGGLGPVEKSRKTFIQNFKTGKFKMLEDLPNFRVHHACFSSKVNGNSDELLIFALGGTLDTIGTDVFSMVEMRWFKGPDLCDSFIGKCYHFSSVQIVENQLITWIIGTPETSSFEASGNNLVFLTFNDLDCSIAQLQSPSCSFELLPYGRTSIRRLGFVAASVNLNKHNVYPPKLRVKQKSLPITKLVMVSGDAVSQLRWIPGKCPDEINNIDGSNRNGSKSDNGYSFAMGDFLVAFGGLNLGKFVNGMFIEQSSIKVQRLDLKVPHIHYEGASLHMPMERLWITGGRDIDGTYSVQTNVLDKRNLKWVVGAGPDLVYPVHGHCLANTNSDPYTVFLIGGRDTLGDTKKLAWGYKFTPNVLLGKTKPSLDKWSKLAGMFQNRYMPACTSIPWTLDGTVYEEILVVGGADHDIVLNNVEVYNPGLNIWKKLKSQKLPRLLPDGSVNTNFYNFTMTDGFTEVCSIPAAHVRPTVYLVQGEEIV